MNQRNLVFANGEIYHVFNRSIAQVPIFRVLTDYYRFINLIDYYRFKQNLSYSHFIRLERRLRENLLNSLDTTSSSVEILAFCLMTNHFHFLLQQVRENGVRKFIANIQNGYAKYFNTKHNRSGSLFQVRFKSVRVETDEQFLHVSRYMHLNPSNSYLVEPENLLSYKWSSLADYFGNSKFGFVKSTPILNLINGKENYKEFVFNRAEYQRDLENIKHLCLE